MTSYTRFTKVFDVTSKVNKLEMRGVIIDIMRGVVTACIPLLKTHSLGLSVHHRVLWSIELISMIIKIISITSLLLLTSYIYSERI